MVERGQIFKHTITRLRSSNDNKMPRWLWLKANSVCSGSLTNNIYSIFLSIENGVEESMYEEKTPTT